MIQAEKRRPAPLAVKLQVALAQLADALRKLGLVPAEGEIVFELDHDPALELRYVNPQTGSHEPHQHDPRFLLWRPAPQHREKTSGRRGESKLSIRDGDQGKIAKNRRRDKKRKSSEINFDEFPVQETKLNSPKSPKTRSNRKMQGKGFAKKPPQRRATGYQRRGV